MSSLMFYCLKVLISAIFEKRLTDGQTDKATHRDAWKHQKMLYQVIIMSSYVIVEMA